MSHLNCGTARFAPKSVISQGRVVFLATVLSTSSHLSVVHHRQAWPHFDSALLTLLMMPDVLC